MGTTRNEHFVILSDEGIPDVEFYINSKGQIFAQEIDGNFFFLLNKEDWEELKKFIDEQFATK